MRTLLRYLVLTLLALATGPGAGAESVGFGCRKQLDGRTVSIQFYSPTIVRVSVWPGSGVGEKKSYSVVAQPGQGLGRGIDRCEADGRLTLQSARIRVTLNLADGAVTFADSTGRTLLRAGAVTLTPCTHAVDSGKYAVSQEFTLEPDEAVYGMGQLRDTAMNRRGRDVEFWNHNTYISIPYLTSEKGYGLYWDNAGRSRWTDSPATGRTVFSSEVAPCVDYYFLYRDGTQDGVVAAIRQLTGRATMFPLWTMGYWQCRERYKTSDELASVLDEFRRRRLPLDGIVQDWQYWGCDSNWNAMRFMNPYYINKVGDPEWQKYLPADMRSLPARQTPRLKSPEEMVDYVHRNNAHLMISVWASFGPWTPQYRELKKIGALYPFDTWPRRQGVMPYDAFNPKARDIYWRHLSHLYGMGMDAWWTDSTEPDHFEQPGDDDWLTADGSWRSVKNAFPLVHNRGIYEHQRALRGNGRRVFQMTRSGTFGMQHYGAFSWSGDIAASWDEMKQQVPSGLNYTLCGIPIWNTDLGGFFYWGFEQNPHNAALKELQTRWMQWGVFMPLMRNHCSSPMVSEPWRFGDEGDWCYDAIRAGIRLRYRLLPYIYSTLADCVLNDGSMMRPLVMDFRADRRAARLNDEYLFGRSLLVKPVTDPLYTWKDAQKRGHLIYPDLQRAAAPVRVYLPKGSAWYDFWTNERHDGGQELLRPCPIDIMPVYVRAGTVMPFGPDVQYSSEKPWDDLEIRVYPGADGSFTLYEDAGDGYDYERGQYATIRFGYDDAAHRLTIGARRGRYKGMLARRRFRVVLVGADSGRGDRPMQGAQTVDYDGRALSLML